MTHARQLSETLAGCSILLPVDRRSGEFATALQRHGAETTIAPPLAITSHFDDAELLAETRALIADPPDIVVATTGVGFRGWMDAAEQDGVQQELVEVLEQARILVRGRRPVVLSSRPGWRSTGSPRPRHPPRSSTTCWPVGSAASGS